MSNPYHSEIFEFRSDLLRPYGAILSFFLLLTQRVVPYRDFALGYIYLAPNGAFYK